MPDISKVLFDQLSGTGIAIEDIIEEYVGQIRDEYDEDELKQVKKIAENTYEVEGALNLTDLNETLGLELESENYNSVGGYIIEKLERFPVVGDKVETTTVRFEVIKVEDNRIEKVKIVLKSNKEEVI